MKEDYDNPIWTKDTKPIFTCLKSIMETPKNS